MNSKNYPKANRRISLKEQAHSPRQPKLNKNKEIESQKEISSEFLIRQKLYEDLNKFPNYESENLLKISERKESHYNKFRTIIEDAKQRFINSDSQQSKNYLEKQQSSMKLIVEQLRNQKRLQNQVHLNQTQNIESINLNLVLSLAIPILCLIVVFLELLKQELIII
ncbi:unnamed protein product [Paramecium pentaurelia]|uniref:Transmembrane protein n=1 Tax=Paramecium pentaurelia TaxID=43138 RepID=A0A8S1X8Q1_9CILI|nr:unnamed protein product [Paramecium pentaurelia]